MILDLNSYQLLTIFVANSSEADNCIHGSRRLAWVASRHPLEQPQWSLMRQQSQTGELAALHSITSSARARSDCGMAKPRVWAILELLEPKVEGSRKPAIPWKLRVATDNGLKECPTEKS